MIQGFIDGIKNMIGSIGNAAKSVADKVKSFLHFSRPDEGPLRDYEKWMPDMIEGLSKTLDSSAPKLYNASKQLAEKVAEGLDMSSMLNDMSYSINTNIVPNSLISSINTSVKTNDINPENIMYDTMKKAISDSDITNNDDRPINLSVYVGNDKLGNILLEDLRNLKRQSGKSIEVLVN